MNIRISKLPAIAVLSSAIAAPALAHHSFAAEFDVSRGDSAYKSPLCQQRIG